MNLSNDSASAACNGLVDRCDVSGAGKLKLYTATKAVDANTAVGLQTELAVFKLGNPAFGAAVNGVATANAITPVTAGADGDAVWFRVYNYNSSAILWDGTVSAAGGGGDLILSSVILSTGGSVSISSWTVTMPLTA